MGADVYLESVSTKCKAKWEKRFKAAVTKRDSYPRGSAMADKLQEKVTEAYNGMYAEGYFRDCYNGYGLFAQTDISWWRDVVPMLNDGGYLPIDKAIELRKRVMNEKLNLASALKVAKEQKESPPKLETYESWRKELVDILTLSIEMGEPLFMSL
jgi:hypothetical protein